MFDEPQNNKITLYAVNDLTHDVSFDYEITEVYSGKKICGSKVTVPADSVAAAAEIITENDEQKFYLIEWTFNGERYKNHYCTNLLNIDYKKYLSALKKCGFDEFEGFDK